MKKTIYYIALFLLATLGLTNSGCAFLNKRPVAANNYYVLDYLPATEQAGLIQAKAFDKTLEVFETSLPRTYDRNQIVRKKSYSQISYFPNEFWSTRLYEAVPNLIVRRLRAYNIFKNVSRDLGETKPDFFLESFIQNIEYVDGPKPFAFLRMEMVLKDSRSQAVVFANRNEASRPLLDTSMEYVVQCFNEMIMDETDMFASKCIDFLNGKPVEGSFLVASREKADRPAYALEQIWDLEELDAQTGELRVPLLMATEIPLAFEATYKDSTNARSEAVTGIMNEVMVLHQGLWNIQLTSDQIISTDVFVRPQMRTVVKPFWSEMIVRVIDESQTRVKMRYDVFAKTPGQDAYDLKVNTRYSPADEVGEYDHLWVLRPGNYLITVNGAAPNSYKDFTTISLEPAKSYILTIVVDPNGDRSVLIGAGLLESPVTRGRPRIHKGAIHTDINLASNNSVDKDNPTNSISLSGEFDNKLEYDIWPLHYITRSIYDLGFDKTTGTDFRVNIDDYSLKNALVLYPWQENRFLRNFGLYGRGDINTHFFKEYSFFTTDKNFIKISGDGDSLIVPSAKKLKIKDEFYPLRLKEGTGLTYRINLSPRISVNLRSGFGWQQDHEDGVYILDKSVILDTLSYDIYREISSTKTQGLENSVIIGMNNLLGFLSVASTIDILFPMGTADKSTKYDNENLINIKLYRNISVDIRAKVKYNKALRDYVQTDYSAFLRLSLYY